VDLNKDESAQREAEHRVAALYNLGWEAGTGAAIWARTAEDELIRHSRRENAAEQAWAKKRG
jgi:hypothetical protein